MKIAEAVRKGCVPRTATKLGLHEPYVDDFVELEAHPS